MAKADFVTGLILLALGVYMIFEGLRLPGAGGFIEVGGEPGRVPIMVGSAIALLAMALVGRAIARGGYRLRVTAPIPAAVRVGARRCLAVAALCSFYAVGLLGAEIGAWKVAYHQATFAFLLVFVVAFEWRFAPELAAGSRAFFDRRAPVLARAVGAVFAFVPPRAAPYLWLLTVALLQAALVTWAVTYLFEQQFYVKLP